MSLRNYISQHKDALRTSYPAKLSDTEKLALLVFEYKSKFGLDNTDDIAFLSEHGLTVQDFETIE